MPVKKRAAKKKPSGLTWKDIEKTVGWYQPLGGYSNCRIRVLSDDNYVYHHLYITNGSIASASTAWTGTSVRFKRTSAINVVFDGTDPSTVPQMVSTPPVPPNPKDKDYIMKTIEFEGKYRKWYEQNGWGKVKP